MQRPPPGGPLTRQRLTVSQERNLVIAAECGDSEACRKLVEAFLPAIANLARGFRGSRARAPRAPAGGRRRSAPRRAPLRHRSRYAVLGLCVVLGPQGDAGARRRADRRRSPCRTAPSASSRGSGTRGASTCRRTAAEPTTDELSRATGLTPAQLASLQATERRPRSMRGVRGRRRRVPRPPSETRSSIPPRSTPTSRCSTPSRSTASATSPTQLDERERTVVRAHYGLGEDAQTLSADRRNARADAPSGPARSRPRR